MIKCVIKIHSLQLGVVVHAHNPSTQEAVAGRSWVSGQAVIQSKTLNNENNGVYNYLSSRACRNSVVFFFFDVMIIIWQRQLFFRNAFRVWCVQSLIHLVWFGFVLSARDGIQGLTQARQVLCHWANPHSPAITLYQELSTNIEKKILGLRGKGLEKHVRGFAFDLQHQTKQNIWNPEHPRSQALNIKDIKYILL
jgi:hypothetical protein